MSWWGGSGIHEKVTAAHAYLVHYFLSFSKAVVVVDGSTSLTKSTATMVIVGAASMVVMREVDVLSKAGIAKSTCAIELVVANGVF